MDERNNAESMLVWILLKTRLQFSKGNETVLKK